MRKRHLKICAIKNSLFSLVRVQLCRILAMKPLAKARGGRGAPARRGGGVARPTRGGAPPRGRGGRGRGGKHNAGFAKRKEHSDAEDDDSEDAPRAVC